MQLINTLLTEYPIASLQAAGAVGMAAHWLKRYMKDETSLGMRAFFAKNKKAATGSFITLFGGIFGLVAGGVAAATAQTLATAFLAGFNLNSVFTPHEQA